MKKMIAFTLSLVLLVVFSSSALAVTCGLGHTAMVTKTYNAYRKCDSSSHYVDETVKYECPVCNASGTKVLSTTLALHTYQYTDLGHSLTSDYHAYRAACDKCSYSKQISLPCKGFPHVSPNFISPKPEYVIK